MTQQLETVVSIKSFLTKAATRSLESMATTYAALIPPFAIAGLTVALQEYCAIVAHGRS